MVTVIELFLKYSEEFMSYFLIVFKYLIKSLHRTIESSKSHIMYYIFLYYYN